MGAEGLRGEKDHLDSQGLASVSVRSMLAHQVASGAFLASRDFPPYQFCWLRDGSFIAFALDRAGERVASERFHRWAAGAIAGIAPTIRTATERRLAGGANLASSMPPARFAVDGSPDVGGWPNFQVDGYGTWLWSLSEHVDRWGAEVLAAELSQSVELATEYLEAVDLDPCYDCWEENGEAVHTSTLACVYGGLLAASRLTGRELAGRKAQEVAHYILSRMRNGARFAKSTDNNGVDASLLWLTVPFGLVSAGDAAMAATAAEIAQGLNLGGGTRRYSTDTYYGGGAWPLLTAWLGWYRCITGDLEGARRCATWVEGCFDAAGHLPEQVGGDGRDPSAFRAWVSRWGPPAADLAWSHAMYFVLSDELERLREPPEEGRPEGGMTGHPDASTNEWAAGPPSAATRIAAGAAAPHPPNQATQGALEARVDPQTERKGAEVQPSKTHLSRSRSTIKASLVAGACAVTSVSGLAGITSLVGTQVASASPTVTLQFWNAYNETDKEASTMANVVLPQFEKENPGIKVTNVTVPYSDLLQKYIAAAAAGDPPAVMRSDIIWVPELASQGVLLNLTKQSWFQAIKKDALPGPLSTNYYQGSYYGMPDDTNTQVLFWNKADFAAAGLSGPPTTIGQLWADAQKLTVKSKGQYGLGVDGTDIWNVAPYIWSSGGSFTNPAYTTTTGYMNGSATESTLQEMLNLQKSGDIGNDFLGGSGSVSGETGFPKGQYAMYIDGPWAVPTFRQDHFSGYGMALIPKGSGGSISTVGGEDLVVSNNDPHVGDAVKLAQFLAGPFAQLQMANQGDLATYKSDAAAEVKAQPFLGIFVQQLGTAEARPVSPAYTRLDGDFVDELQEALAGKLPLDNAMNAASSQSNGALTGS